MLELIYEGKFLKELALCSKRGCDTLKIEQIIVKLRNNQPLDPKHRDHKLHGNFIGYRECHITNDWLLIYKKTDLYLILSRTGTHSDLFK